MDRNSDSVFGFDERPLSRLRRGAGNALDPAAHLSLGIYVRLGRMRRMKQQQEFKKAREALLEKVAARSFAKNYLSSLKSDVSTGRRRFERAVLFSVLYHPVRGKIHAICLCFVLLLEFLR